MSAVLFPPIPPDTVRAAKATYEPTHLYMLVGDSLESLFVADDLLVLDALYISNPRPPVAPALLVLVTLFQFIEDLPDRLAGDAVRTRVDWKYALHLPLDYPGFDHAALDDWRERFLQHEETCAMVNRVLNRLEEPRRSGNGSCPQMDAVRLVCAVHILSRLHLAIETMRRALEALAGYWPEWLQTIALPHWYGRYSRQYLSSIIPRDTREREALMPAIAADGFHLLEALARADAPSLAARMAESRMLRQVWQRQFGSYDHSSVPGADSIWDYQ
jgi:transposase